MYIKNEEVEEIAVSKIWRPYSNSETEGELKPVTEETERPIHHHRVAFSIAPILEKRYFEPSLSIPALSRWKPSDTGAIKPYKKDQQQSHTKEVDDHSIVRSTTEQSSKQAEETWVTPTLPPRVSIQCVEQDFWPHHTTSHLIFLPMTNQMKLEKYWQSWSADEDAQEDLETDTSCIISCNNNHTYVSQWLLPPETYIDLSLEIIEAHAVHEIEEQLPALADLTEVLTPVLRLHKIMFVNEK